MSSSLLSHCLEVDLAVLHILNELRCKGTVLNVGKDLLHSLLHFRSNDLRSGYIIAVLSCVGDGVAHAGKSGLIDQINDELHLVDALKVCITGIIACLAKGLEACLHQGTYAAAQNSLLAEEVGLSLGLKGGLKDTCACAADGCTVCKSLLQCLSGSILLYCNQHRSSLACLVLGTNGMSGSLGSDHGNIHICRRNDELVVDVEAVGEHQHITGLEVRLYVLLIHISLQLVIDQDHDDIGLLYSLSGGKNLQSLCLCLCLGLGALVQTNHYITSGILQIQCVCMALGAITNHTDLLSLEKREITIFLIKNSCLCHFCILLL